MSLYTGFIQASLGKIKDFSRTSESPCHCFQELKTYEKYIFTR